MTTECYDAPENIQSLLLVVNPCLAVADTGALVSKLHNTNWTFPFSQTIRVSTFIVSTCANCKVYAGVGKGRGREEKRKKNNKKGPRNVSRLINKTLSLSFSPHPIRSTYRDPGPGSFAALPSSINPQRVHLFLGRRVRNTRSLLYTILLSARGPVDGDLCLDAKQLRWDII